LAQKSLKTELRLKRYRVLELYVLKCKLSELEIDFLLNQGLNHNLIQAQGLFVQNCRINPNFDLFLQRKIGGPSPRAVDRARVAGPRLTHDWDRAARSPKHGSPTLQSPGARRGWGKRRGASGVLTEGFGGRFDGEARLAAVKGERQR
jgi:hypothetical protein